MMRLSQCGFPIMLDSYWSQHGFMTGSGQEDHKERSVGEASGKKKIFLAYKKKHMTRTSLFSAFGSDQLI